MLRHRVLRSIGILVAALASHGLASADPVPVPATSNGEPTRPDAAAATESAQPDAPANAQPGVPVVELRKSVNVYTRPSARWRYFRGTVTKKTRVQVLEQKSGKGCKGTWLRIGERRWICTRSPRATEKPVGGRSLDGLQDNSLLPKEYVVTRDAPVYPSLADVTGGTSDASGQTIRGLGGFVKGRTARRDGRRYVRTPHGWVADADVKTVQPSAFKGVRLSAADRGKRLAFVRVKRARLYDAKGKRRKGHEGRGPALQTYLGAIGEPVVVGKRTLYPIDESSYVRAADISLLSWPAPPKEVLDAAGTPTERWIDVSVSRQLLVAYQGADPVMATLVSTARTATTPGVYRIQKKRAYGRLRARPGYKTQWDVHVPWVMTLDGRLAMHTVYWHENFGKPFSQGCVNLAPIDAKWLWDWTEPTLPAGWVRVTSDEQEPGTVVRIRK